MRLLANENIPGPVVRALRQLGHDVLWIKESGPGTEDSVALALAQSEQRVVVTADTDFGELAFKSGLSAVCGVVLIRIDWSDPDHDNQLVVSAITSRDAWTGVFAVVERDRIRIRPLPSRSADS
jgi:predicted nuclease of predicted toxin-antitoxin system